MLETSTSPPVAQRRDARADVDGKAGDVVRLDLDLAAMYPSSYLEAEFPDFVADGRSAMNRSSGPIERRQDPVADGLDFVAAEPLYLASCDPVMLIEEVVPTRVAEFRRQSGRADDIREQDRGEHPVRLRSWTDTGYEILDLRGQPLGIDDP